MKLVAACELHFRGHKGVLMSDIMMPFQVLY